MSVDWAQKGHAAWHRINCLLLGLSLVEKFVCYCVKCYLCAYPSVRAVLLLWFLHSALSFITFVLANSHVMLSLPRTQSSSPNDRRILWIQRGTERICIRCVSVKYASNGCSMTRKFSSSPSLCSSLSLSLDQIRSCRGYCVLILFASQHN